MTKKRVQLAFGITLSIIFLYIAFNGINWRDVGISLQKASYWLLIPAIILHFCAFYIRSYKWSVIVSHFKRVSVNELFPIVSIGLAMNNILPLRAGEIGRVFLLANKFGATKVQAGVSIVLERLFDIIGLFLLLLFVLSIRQWPTYITKYISFAFVLTLIVLIALPVLLFLGAQSSPEFAKKLHFLPILKLIQEAKEAYFLFRKPAVILYLSLLSLTLWIAESMGYFFVSLAFHLNISLTDFFFICVIINLASAIPSSSAYIGTFEFVGTALLVFLGISRPLALSYILILHVELVIPITLVGLYLYFAKRYYTFMNLHTIEEIEYGTT